MQNLMLFWLFLLRHDGMCDSVPSRSAFNCRTRRRCHLGKPSLKAWLTQMRMALSRDCDVDELGGDGQA
jgi:hypothetical protein